MTTKKKTTTKSTAKKADAPKAAKTTAKKTTTKAAAAVAVAEPVTEAKENLTVTIAPEAPETAAPAVEAVATVPAAVTVEVKAETPAQKPVLTIGMLQHRLQELGYYHGWCDGHYGPLTKQAVGHFQWKNGIYADGNATPETLKALGF